MNVQFFKVSTLPSVLEANALYYVNTGTYVEQYVTDTAGNAKLIHAEALINSLITTAISDYNALEIVDTIADRDLLFTGTVNKMVLVNDASADSTVTSGSALYSYRGSDSVVTKVSEYESLDVVFDWNVMINKPSSSVADIDDAVTKRHAHANKAVLDDITEDANGRMLFKGNTVRSIWESLDW